MNWAGLIVGLGNPGREYEATRHNMGFMLADALLAEAQKNNLQAERLGGDKFRCELWKIALPKSPKLWLLAKPQTFMNESGRSVQPLAAWHKISPSQILVAHDELDLPFGRMRCKTGGGNAGHNGLASITEQLGTADFHRLRLGIGRPPHGTVISWVLGRFAPTEAEHLEAFLRAGVSVVHSFAKEGPKAALQAANAYKIDIPPVAN